VHGVIEDRSGEYKSVGEGDGKASVQSRAHTAKHAAGGGTVEINRVSDARIHGGNHEGLLFSRKSDVADKSFIENFVNLFAIVNTALRLAQSARPLRLRNIFFHGIPGMNRGAEPVPRGPLVLFFAGGRAACVN